MTIEAHDFIQNRTFDEIAIGDAAHLVRTLRPEDIHLFAVMSGDVNPTHVDPEFARSSQFREVVGHSMWGSVLISSILGTEFPGPGTVYVGQTLKFWRPIPSATPSRSPSPAPIASSTTTTCCSNACASTRTA